MKRNAAKGLVRKPSSSLKPEQRTKTEAAAASSTDRKRNSRGSRILQELFEVGAQTFKRLDTDTIMRIAEDKDLEYL